MPFVVNIIGFSAKQGTRFGTRPWVQIASPKRGVLGLAVLLTVALCAGCRKEKGSTRKEKTTASATSVAETSRPSETPLPVARRLPAVSEEKPPASAVSYAGTLRVHLEAEPPHLNPLLDPNAAVDRVVNGLIYEPLVDCRAGTPEPVLAERWETSPDGLRLTVHLRGGIRFHDEHPFSVVDAQATLETVLKSTSRVPLLRALLADVAAVEILPERQLRLRLHRPSSFVLRALCEVPMLPEGALRAGQAAFAALSRQPNGTGPFRFVAWERGKRIRLQRVATFRGPAAGLDGITFEIEPDSTRALARVRRGDLDVLPRLLDVHWPDQVAPAALGGRVELVSTSPPRHAFVAFNTRHAPLSDARMRRALSMLWNRPAFARDVHRGLAIPIGGPPFGRAPVLPFDPAEAGKILESAGYRDTNGDGVREFDGRPIRVTLLQPSGSRTFATEARKFSHEARTHGLLVDVVNVDAAAIAVRLQKRDFDMAPVQWEGMVGEDPFPLYGSEGTLNVSGYSSSQADLLLGELRTASGTRVDQVFSSLAAVIAADAPVLFLYRFEQMALVSRSVHGLAERGGVLDVRNAWLEPN